MAYSAAHQGQLTHQYDLASRRTRLTWPDGFYVTYEYDLADAAIRETGATSGRVRLNSPHMPICAAAFTWLGPASARAHWRRRLKASAMCARPTARAPSRSAMVRATRKVR